MNRIVTTAALVVLLGLSVSACKKGHSMAVVVPPPPPPVQPAAFEDQFAAVFAEAFRASPNSEPRDIAAGDVIPVNVTAEPVSLP